MKAALTIVAAMILAGAASGQETLTLERAVTLALEQNHSLRAAQHDLDAARWGSRNSITTWLPKVEVSAGLTRIDPQTEARANAAVDFIKASASSLGIPPSALANIKPFAYRDTYTTSVTLVQPIYNGGLELLGIRAAGAMTQRSSYGLRETEQQVVADVQTAYATVLKAQALVALSREAADRTRRWLDMTERRAALGQRTNTDVLRFKVQLAADEGNIVNAENYLAMARIRLNELMGEDLQKAYTLQEILAQDSALAASGSSSPFRLASHSAPLPEQGIGDAFLSSHPSMKVMEANMQLADLGVSKAWSSFQPRVNLAFQYGWEQNNTPALDGIKPWAISLAVSLPIFNSFGDYTNLQKAEAEAERTREQVVSFRRGLLMQATNATLTLKAARKRIDIAKAGLQQAEDVLNSVSRRYELGAASNVDLLDVQTAYTSAKTDYVTALYDAHIAAVELARATGALQ